MTPTKHPADRNTSPAPPSSDGKSGTVRRLIISLDKLRTHPRQTIYNPTCSDAEDRSLQASLAAEGQRDFIHVMPPGNAAGLEALTILDGHRRAQALRAIGKSTAKVVIREDLKDADASTVELLFLGFNATRRQLDLLAVANNERRRLELEKGRDEGELRDWERQELNDRLAAKFQMSRRNALRYVGASHAPPEVQKAHRDGRLKLIAADKVGQLDRTTQLEIAERIAADPDQAAVIVAEFLAGSRPGKSTTVTPIAVRLMRTFERELPALEGRYHKINGPRFAKFLPVLCRAETAIRELKAAAKRPEP